MFSISQTAVSELNAFFSDRPKSSIRIYLAPGGCSGPRLSLALDEPGEDDSVLTDSGYDFCMSKSLLEQVGGVSIDATPMGFLVTPEIALPQTGGGCCAGCAGCH
ncbi:MAG: IscA/HesB family protein [Mailhella sp.]|nr:IscA/HesB family protein [Mailhella sp.]